MPFVNIKVAGPTLAPEQIRRLQARTAELAVTELACTLEVTSVLIEQPAIGGWAVNGRPALVAAHIDAKITVGTARPAAKFQPMIWGYDGPTQAERLASDGGSAPV
jgi:phenylpyruvate tautomerase PptA (4-oxalocrotonate tautomerase family)